MKYTISVYRHDYCREYFKWAEISPHISFCLTLKPEQTCSLFMIRYALKRFKTKYDFAHLYQDFRIENI